MSEEKKNRSPKVVVTAKVDASLLDRAKAVAYWTPGMTLSRLVEDGVRAYLEEWEKEHGEPKAAPGHLRNGRPITLRSVR